MSNYDNFLQIARCAGIDTNSMYQEDCGTYNIISFEEETETGLYDICIVIYKDNDTVELCIKDFINITNLDATLLHINSLNIKYDDVSFILDNSKIGLKSTVYTKGDITVAIAHLINCVKIAKEEFCKF